MSHYVLFTMTDVYPADYVLDELLAPYDESTRVERYKSREEPKWVNSWASHCEHLLIFLESKGITAEDYYADTIEGDSPWKREDGPIRSEFKRLHEDYVPSWGGEKDEYTREDLVAMHAAISAFSEGEEDELQIDDEGLYRWSSYNPRSKWDWWQVGGRWAGYFKLKDGAKGEKGSPGLMGSQLSEDGVDIARVGDIDWDAMLAERSEGVGERWDRVRAVAQELPTPPEEGSSRDEWQAWWKSEAVSKVTEAFRRPHDVFPFFGGPAELEYVFDMERDEYIDFVAWNACLPYSYLDEDGWEEPGRMGWFGMSTDTKESWLQFKNKIKSKVLAKENQDKYLAALDLHI